MLEDQGIINYIFRRYAGTRYLKRGIDDKGHVANDIEIEQIIEDSEGYIASYVQVY